MATSSTPTKALTSCTTEVVATLQKGHARVAPASACVETHRTTGAERGAAWGLCRIDRHRPSPLRRQRHPAGVSRQGWRSQCRAATAAYDAIAGALRQLESVMLKQIEGSRAMAEGIALCRPEVICAYPITPQTHIVEGLGEMVRRENSGNASSSTSRSEFAALSVAIGASAAGARTRSQGLLFMAEAVYNASGLGLPIVMTLGNRAIGAPINIWNDHSDAMSMRDAGWMQLFAETNQEASTCTSRLFGWPKSLDAGHGMRRRTILTHAVERIDIPDQADVDAFLRPYEPVQVLDPEDPISIGAMVGPDAFTEVRFLQNYKQNLALRLLPEFAAEFKARFGRESGGLLRSYRTDDAEPRRRHGIGQRHDQRHDRRNARADGFRVGLVTLISFRPFPTQALREVLVGAKHVVVIEKSFAIGMGGQLANNVDLALRNRRRASGAFGRRRARRTPNHAGVAAPAIPPRARAAVGRRTLSRPQRSDRRQGAPPRSQGTAVGTYRREYPASPERGRPAAGRRVRGRHERIEHDLAGNTEAALLSEGHLHCRQPAGVGGNVPFQASIDRSNALTCGHRACQGAARRSAHATPSTRQCERPPASSSRSMPLAASKYLRRPILRPPGRLPGCIRCSATRPRSLPASQRRCASSDEATCA